MSNVTIGTRISELPATSYPSLQHLIPASKDGETVKLTIEQIKSILALVAEDVAFRTGTVESALAALVDAPAPEDFTQQIADLSAAFAALPAAVSASVYETQRFYGI
ncbi:hypothetical protein D3218_13150 [Aureimonas flava]|uniref:Uncharacterized protein n=1 Tax=Aureimonas flava TaxID=2320271 RepID=A0A3A1WJ10_9HYPH|nr:hypothetical protein [Aureimonas flava]RIY00226.1 hypothetical protein D3218_13150 [Aureimonas flava]